MRKKKNHIPTLVLANDVTDSRRLSSQRAEETPDPYRYIIGYGDIDVSNRVLFY